MGGMGWERGGVEGLTEVSGWAKAGRFQCTFREGKLEGSARQGTGPALLACAFPRHSSLTPVLSEHFAR